MGCQTKIAQKIVDSSADYVLALKKNQEKLHEIVEGLFSDPDEIKATHCDYHQEVNKGHGRIEIRQCWATDDEEYLQYIEQELGHWEGLQSLIMMKSELRINENSSTENLAIMRHLCLNLLKRETTAKCGIKAKRLKAGWDMNCLFMVLSA